MNTLALNESPAALRVQETITIVLSSILLALAAQLSIRLPFSPVPLILHDTTAIFLGILLGPRRAALAVTLYLLEGAAGLPVFASGGAGLAYLLGPTGGYLLGFVPAAAIAGLVARTHHHPMRQLLAFAAGSVVIFALGMSHLAHFVGWSRVIPLGMLPFIPGNLIKSLTFSYGRESFSAAFQRLRG